MPNSVPRLRPGLEALVFKASRGIEDIYELTYFRKDGSRFPAVVSVTALRDAQDGIIGYLLIGTDNTARKQAEEALVKAGSAAESDLQQRQLLQYRYRCQGRHPDLQRWRGTHAGSTWPADVMNKIDAWPTFPIRWK